MVLKTLYRIYKPHNNDCLHMGGQRAQRWPPAGPPKLAKVLICVSFFAKFRDFSDFHGCQFRIEFIRFFNNLGLDHRSHGNLTNFHQNHIFLWKSWILITTWSTLMPFKLLTMNFLEALPFTNWIHMILIRAGQDENANDRPDHEHIPNMWYV